MVQWRSSQLDYRYKGLGFKSWQTQNIFFLLIKFIVARWVGGGSVYLESEGYFGTKGEG